MPHNPLLLPVVKEVVVSNVLVVEQVHEQQVVVDEGAVNEGVREVVDRHRVVVQAKPFVDVQLVLKDLFLSSFFWAVAKKDPEVEAAIVEVADRKNGAIWVLFDLIALDVADELIVLVLSASDLLLESHSAGFE